MAVKVGEKNMIGGYVNSLKTVNDDWKFKQTDFTAPQIFNIPEDYTQVEYIESDGNMSVDTDIHPTLTMVMECIVDTRYNVSSSNFNLTLGVCGLNGTSSYQGFSLQQQTTYIGRRIGTDSGYVNLPVQNNFFYNYLSCDKQSVTTYQGNTSSSTYPYAAGTLEQVDKGTIAIGRNRSNVSKDLLTDGLRIHIFKLSDNNVTTALYLPVVRKSDGIAGFYDIVSESFKTNYDGSALIAGNAVVQYEEKKINKIMLGTSTAYPSIPHTYIIDGEVSSDVSNFNVTINGETVNVPVVGGNYYISYAGNVTNLNNTFIDAPVKTLHIADGFDTSHIESINNTFYNNSNIISCNNIGRLITSSTTGLTSTFRNAQNVETIDMSDADLSNVTTLLDVFDECKNLKNLTLPSVGCSNKCTNLQALFRSMPLVETLDLSGWDTSNVSNMRHLFSAYNVTSKLKTLILDGWSFDKIGSNSELTQNSDTGWMYNQDALINLSMNGAKINQNIKFEMCPNINITSLKSILSSLQPVQTKNCYFSAGQLQKINDDTDAVLLLYTAMGNGWTFSGYAMPSDVFRLDSGSIQSGLTINEYPSGAQATSYNEKKYYKIASISSNSVDFNTRGVKGGLDLRSGVLTYINVSNNTKLSKVQFNHNDADTVIKPYNTSWWNNIDRRKFIETYATAHTSTYSVIWYVGDTIRLTVGDTDYQYTPTSSVDNSYIEVEYSNGIISTVKTLYNYTASIVTYEITAVFDAERTDGKWVESSLAPTTDLIGQLYQSDSNHNVNNSYSKMYLKVLPQTEDKSFDLYINSFAESRYDYTIAFGLDVDYTDSSIPSYDTSGVVVSTRSHQYYPDGSLSSNYKKYTYVIPSDGQEHFICVIYRKDNSTHKNYDRGYTYVSHIEHFEPV